eukprot:3388117-Rhodomonas_salina.2
MIWLSCYPQYTTQALQLDSLIFSPGRDRGPSAQHQPVQGCRNLSLIQTPIGSAAGGATVVFNIFLSYLNF